MLGLVLFIGTGCAESLPERPVGRLSPHIDLLALAPPQQPPEGWTHRRAERQAWSFADGLPDGWSAGPPGVRVTDAGDGILLECDTGEPWLELHREIDPLLYHRVVFQFTPRAEGRAALQFAFHRPGAYRPYDAERKPFGPVGAVQRRNFRIPDHSSAESVIHSIRLHPGGSGDVVLRGAALIPRPAGYIRDRVLPQEMIPLAQAFKRCWRFAGGGTRRATFIVPSGRPCLDFATGTLAGKTGGLVTVELDDGEGPAEVLGAPIPPAGEGWRSERAGLDRWTGKEVTITVGVETGDPHALHLVGTPRVLADEPEPRPNVLIIVIDTLRADHLSGYGHRQRTSPHLDRLARQGILFTSAISPASWTLPAMAAAFTGRYPGTGGIGHGPRAGVPAGTPTLAGLLGGAGWSTAGFSANALLDTTRGFHRGFDHYFLSPYTDNQFTAGELNRRALEWIEQHSDERFFCFLQYMDPHNPYDAPPFETGFGDPDDPEGWKRGHVRALIAGEQVVDHPDDLARIERFYDEEIRYTDRHIGRLLARLRRLGLLGQTLVLVTADHGEELHDRGSWGHGFTLYQELVHVPLILKLPESMAGPPAQVDTPVSLIDIAPTIAGFAEIPLPADGFPGQDLLRPSDGRFLRSGIWSKRAPDYFAVTGRGWKQIYLNGLPGGGRPARAESRPESAGKTVGSELFFDLRDDPGERVNLAGTAPAAEQEFRKEMKRWLAELNAESSPAEEECGKIDRELAERLRAMGYLE